MPDGRIFKEACTQADNRLVQNNRNCKYRIFSIYRCSRTKKTFRDEINFAVNFFPILMVGQKTISSNLEPICGCQPYIK